MARRLQVNRCMICSEAPCACNKPVPKTKKILKRPDPVVVTPDFTAPVTKALTVHTRKPTPEAPRKAAQLTVGSSKDDADLHRALRVLAAAGLMSQADKDKYRQILVSGNPTEDRAAAWRARREARS